MGGIVELPVFRNNRWQERKREEQVRTSCDYRLENNSLAGGSLAISIGAVRNCIPRRRRDWLAEEADDNQKSIARGKFEKDSEREASSANNPSNETGVSLSCFPRDSSSNRASSLHRLTRHAFQYLRETFDASQWTLISRHSPFVLVSSGAPSSENWNDHSGNPGHIYDSDEKCLLTLCTRETSLN